MKTILKNIATLCFAIAAFILVSDKIDYCSTDDLGNTKCTYVEYCATSVKRQGQFWIVTLSDGNTVRFTLQSKLIIDTSRECK